MKPILIAVVAALGCVHAPELQAEHVLTGAASAPWTGPVRIVMEGAPGAGAYDEVAVVSARGVSREATLPAVLGALQAEAAQLGCNAVVHVRFEHGASTATATGVAVWMNAPPQ